MKRVFFYQLIPIFLTIATFVLLVVFIYSSILLLNLLPIQQKIIPVIHITDVLIGLTIYLKTSIDFALFLGNVMRSYNGVKNRIAIELGTSLGNGIGTLLILCIWTLFKEIPLLLVFMIFLAAIVLLRMAEEGLGEFLHQHTSPPTLKRPITLLLTVLKTISFATSPLTRFILPSSLLSRTSAKTALGVIGFSFTVPFILGLDDFAGYIPLFSLVNVFGFAVGAFFGHMLLTTALFSSPTLTVKIVRHPIVIVLGSVAFLIIAGIGIFEGSSILHHYLLPR